VTVAVRDFGIGISPDEQKKIFDRFHRVSTGLVHDVRGSGLGLSIVSHVASAHGGKVKVRSELGRGSTFTLFLPLAVERAPTAEEGADAARDSTRETERQEAG
jgi:signal transduction histidine kinase